MAASNDDTDVIARSVSFIRDAGIGFVRRYNRLTVTIDEPIPVEPTLIVANHGFGGLVDLNVMALLATLQDLALDRPVTFLTHRLAWTLQVGSLIEKVGARPANLESAESAFQDGHHVVVFPGGDREAAKSFADRDRVMFSGRHGFARVAISVGVPIVPVVTAGAGESLLVIDNGEALARALRLDRLLRYSVLPISFSIPWGLNIGMVGLLPYLPLPTKLDTQVLTARRPTDGEEAADYALRIEAEMQTTLTALTRRRRPIIG